MSPPFFERRVYRRILTHVRARLETMAVLGNTECDALLPVLQSMLAESTKRDTQENMRMMETVCGCGGTADRVCTGKTKTVFGILSNHIILETWFNCLVAKTVQFDQESQVESTQYGQYQKTLDLLFQTIYEPTRQRSVLRPFMTNTPKQAGLIS